MSKQTWLEDRWGANQTAPTAVANTTTETSLFTDYTIFANTTYPNQRFHIHAQGKYSTTATPTMIFGVRWGGAAGVLICKTAACTTTTVTNALWDLDVWLQVLTLGSSGTIRGNGICRVCAGVAGTVASATGEALVTPLTNGGVVTPADATIDTTVDKALAITLTWSAASASNTATGLYEHIVEL